MKPQYLNDFSGRQIVNGITRLAAYDLPIIVGDVVCRLLRSLNVIEDFFVADRFPLRPLYAYDKDADGTLHIAILHAHIIIQKRRRKNEYGPGGIV